MSTCTDECVNVGITFIRGIIQNIIQHVDPHGAVGIGLRINAAINTLRCKLPQDLVDSIENEIIILQNITTTTLEQENTAYLQLYTRIAT